MMRNIKEDQLFLISKNMTEYKSYYYVYAVTDSIVEIRSSLKNIWIPAVRKYDTFCRALEAKNNWQAEIDKMRQVEKNAENEYEEQTRA